MFFDRDFLGTPVNLLSSSQKCQGVPFSRSVKVRCFCSGPISDEELFYLKARGISDSESRKLIIEGFLAGVVERFGNSELLDALVARIDEKLERAV